jgi:adenosyl cobinamide kinase/adenosyl cobinamide phosphate guanylyltransferase
MPFTLVIGGARSGKSSLALRLASASSRPVTFVATAQAGDDDMTARIDRHRAERPSQWRTVEEPLDVHRSLDDSHGTDDAFVIIDCVTMWVANLIFADRSDADIRAMAIDLGTRLAERAAPAVVISNEVGMGIHPETELGRRYRDLLGWVNSDLAAVAERSVLMVAGRATLLHDPIDLLNSKDVPA